jgi:hypothetical protein
MQSAGPEGVLVVSLGTIKYPGQTITDRLKATLKLLPYKVGMRACMSGNGFNTRG